MMCNLKFIVTIFTFLITSVGALAYNKEDGNHENDTISIKPLIDTNLKGFVIFDKSKFSAVANTLHVKGTITVINTTKNLPLQEATTDIRITAVPYCKIQSRKAIKNMFSTTKVKTVAIVKTKATFSSLPPENNGFASSFGIGIDKIVIGSNTNLKKSFNPTKNSCFNKITNFYLTNKKTQKRKSTKFQNPFVTPVFIYGSNEWANRPPPTLTC
jgi:hypothetical protein